jgi:NAD(P)-dependent dehydrogenase (short-subunit alcohol dehydrogenase family)
METQTASPMTLNGKRIVVLGGTSGMGFATAEMAAREGAAIVVARTADARTLIVPLRAFPRGL